LPGVQLIQALVAGNAAALKPAPQGGAVTEALHRAAVEAGIDARLCPVLPATHAAGAAALECGPDKVVLTGSAETGRRIMEAIAPRLTPSTMELSGNDPVFVLPGAKIDDVVGALRFGLRLNKSETCIAPRRVFASRAIHDALAEKLKEPLPGPPSQRLVELAEDARRGGGRVVCENPLIVAEANPALRLLNEDIFAPSLGLVPVESEEAMLEAASLCPYALGASIFGPETAARALAEKVNAGAVTVNDLIAPTADPRLPFGGRGRSGFGVTRGPDGLLEMTVVKTVSVRRVQIKIYHEEPLPEDGALFAAYLRFSHGEKRLGAVGPLLRAACKRVMRGR
jgi:acyl-CoA reductase-like NAD-dependent aldehyde dehydrogenase